MNDPNDVKPDDWDNEPEKIVDPDATKPEDWDDEEDGAWEAPLIDNPKYNGEWKAKQIKNPDYKGPWKHPEIANPDYVEFTEVYKRGPLNYIGIEIWQVKSGTIFSDFIVSDSVEEVESFLKTRHVKKKMKKKMLKLHMTQLIDLQAVILMMLAMMRITKSTYNFFQNKNLPCDKYRTFFSFTHLSD